MAEAYQLTYEDPAQEERFHHLEIEICSACDVNCPMCDRFSDVAVGKPMTVEQIQQFIAESRELDWPWERIRVVGGEPTIHPKFREIVELLLEYKRETKPRLHLEVFTNGRGKLKEHKAWLEERGVVIFEAYKDGTIPYYFDNMWTAPIDTVPGEQPPCGIFGLRACGIGLTINGYYPCGAGASIARVTGMDIGILKLSELTYEKAYDQTKPLCNKCGHAIGFGRHLGDSKFSPMITGRGPFWTKAIDDYAKNRPQLPRY